jgi:Cu(I)/Ag(I) efflux system membrane fusion protein
MTTLPRKVVLICGAVALGAISAAAGYWLALRGVAVAGPGAASVSGGAGQERKPLYWYDPMVPNQRFDKPGKSPYMDMQLVPKFADDAQAERATAVRIDPGIVQNLGVRFTRVERGSLAKSVEAVGTLGFNQRDVAVVQARSGGFVTRVYARAPGDVIDRGAAIVDLLVPEWAGAQSEFLVLLKSGDPDLIQAARQRLLLLGMPAEWVAHIEAAREPRTTITIRSPLAGAIETIEAREGMTVSAGSTLAKINGLATLWLEAAIPEARGALAQLGKTVEVRLTAYPGRSFKGHVIAVLPQADAGTRTVRVRIELPNPDGRLRAGMSAQVRLDTGGPASVLYVASEAIIHTGTRVVAIVAGVGGRFTPTEVKVGDEVNGKTVILEGLAEGQRVVASGQFLIDSEANLKGVLGNIEGNAASGAPRDADEPMPGSPQ